MKENTFIIIYVTHKNKDEAEKVTKHLLSQKLIACVNYLPIQSEYFWKGEMANENEVVTLLKTKNENWDKVKSEVEKIHTYEVPAIIKFEVEANPAYVKWINDMSI